MQTVTSPEEEGGWHASNASNEDDLRHNDFNEDLRHDDFNEDLCHEGLNDDLQ